MEKVWSDYKSAIKKKLAHNNRELHATGGGENSEIPLTSREEVATLVCLNDCVGGIRSSKQFGVPQGINYDDAAPSTSRNVPQMRASATRDVPQERISEDTSPPTRRDYDGIEAHEDVNIENDQNISNQRRKKRPEQFDLLEKQIGVQERLYEKVSESVENQQEYFQHMRDHLKRLNRSVERPGDQKKKNTEILQNTLEEIKRHNAVMEKAAIEKLRLKRELLNIELNNVNRHLNS
ncbi:PREDICTED: uncharacterized protein LOC108371995 [Rhagoletis zephyria]|uniref:uncharacterized protein LOC108360993 n=1 Tax=Rhagoletis zephyria TaxID=28612 RepID=UPI00081166EC|nr:PREDICTED: uncharacterized protein LOC108360993 [Rhagoletis zephyria]XP_017469005.1 PREDICTED: uncharacterized protein LOC108360993 [Rhagoletis zephyria]XP_017483113.1 PREDICTED: uncharacterized protein LOC108371995 [Rhagoletis zephyria]XP_017483114.1 PREDICTED: uncharacterized protein LOC108371995 [Rhagoletis zephyria]